MSRARAAQVLRELAENSEERAALERRLAEALEETAEASPKPARVRGPGAMLELPDLATLPPPNDIERAEAKRRLKRAGIVGNRGRS